MLAFRVNGELVVEDDKDETVLPRGPGGADALAVRSLEDLVFWAQLDTLDYSSPELSGEDVGVWEWRRSPETGLILYARGTDPFPWSVEILSEELVADSERWFELRDLTR